MHPDSLRRMARAALLTAAAVALGAAAAPGLPAPPPAAAAYNTTGPLDRPVIASIGAGVWHINEFGADSIYLIVGERRALVVDTGTGLVDLKALIESLTKLPYDVVVTHSHPDHAGGAGLFETVYVHPADMEAVSRITYEGRVRYGQIMRAQPIGSRNVWAYSDASVRRWPKVPEMKPLAEGQVFDLGGRKVTAHHIPNHTPGSMVFIDDRSRIMFSGDAANLNGGANGTVSSALRVTLRMRELRRDYDRDFWGHVAYAGTVSPIQPKDPQVIDDSIEAYRDILRGAPQIVAVPNNLDRSRTQQRAVHGTAQLYWNPERLWEPGEPHVIP